MDSRPPGRAQQIAAMVLTVAMAWGMLPEHRRRLILMRTVHLCQRAAGRAARHAGHAGMGNELAGRAGDAARHYTSAEQLGRARDQLGRVLEAMRP